MYALQHPERQYSNTGGLESFLFTDAANLLYDPRPRRDLSGSLIIQSVPLINQASWQIASVVRYSLSYRERQRENKQGTSYQQRMEGVIAKSSPVISTILRQFENRRFVLLLKDFNGYYRLVGTKENPLRFSYETDPGSSPRDRNQVSFEFEGEQMRPAYFYDGSLLGQIADASSPDVSPRVTEDGIYIRILE
jgi:hypothetical protein